VGGQGGRDLEAVERQLGRTPSVPFTVVARCPDGHPLVIRNRPIDAEGRPFPTLFWLTCPDAVREVARLESGGWIARWNERVSSDEALAAELAGAHEEYARERARWMPEAIAFGGVGGTRTGVKCLHAHYANHLAGGRDPIGAWVAERVEPIHEAGPATGAGSPVAVVDLGTNSIRLLVASVRADGGLTELARDMVITRIGKDVDRTGRIAPGALARTVEVLGRYCRRARALHAPAVRVAATSAVREATNREELERAVLELAGAELEVISGEREAELSFLGATRGLAGALDARGRPLEARPPFLVVDVGGGSTELAVGAERPEAAVSTRMGSVRMTERFVAHDPPTAAELEEARREIGAILSEVEGTIPAGSARTLVAVAGTATTLRAIDLGLPSYDPEAIHRTWLVRERAERVLAELAAMTNAERAAIPVMPPGRGDVIVCGALILVEVLRRFGFERALVSETDILDGLAFEALEAR